MRARAPRSLFGELLDWMLAPLLVIWPVSVLLTWGVAQNLAQRPFDRQLVAAAQSLAEQLQVAPAGSARQPTLRTGGLALLQQDADDPVVFQVLGADGTLLAGDARLPVPTREADEQGTPHLQDVQLQGDNMRVVTLWVRTGTQPDWLLVQVAEGLGKREQLATDIVKGVLLPQFALLPLSALLAWLALTQGLKPLQTLSDRIRARSADDLSPIAESEAAEELLPLVRATNELLARREHAMQLQHQFLADAAHQLKTPLAGLRMQAELMGRALATGQAGPAELTRSFEQIAVGSQRAANMVNQLLALARTDAGATAPPELIDLASLAREVTQDFVPRAMEKRIDLGFEGPESSHESVLGEPWLLTELVRNLVDNALRYTPRGGEVTVRVTEDPFGHVLVLEVEDSGPGIAPEARERVFQPFYRALGTGVEGSGLGLTIAGQIAERHGSRIELEDCRERRGPETLPGARFRLRLAAQPAPAPEAEPAPPA